MNDGIWSKWLKSFIACHMQSEPKTLWKPNKMDIISQVCGEIRPNISANAAIKQLSVPNWELNCLNYIPNGRYFQIIVAIKWNSSRKHESCKKEKSKRRIEKRNKEFEWRENNRFQSSVMCSVFVCVFFFLSFGWRYIANNDWRCEEMKWQGNHKHVAMDVIPTNETELCIMWTASIFPVMLSFIVINWIKHRITEAHTYVPSHTWKC